MKFTTFPIVFIAPWIYSTVKASVIPHRPKTKGCGLSRSKFKDYCALTVDHSSTCKEKEKVMLCSLGLRDCCHFISDTWCVPCWCISTSWSLIVLVLQRNNSKSCKKSNRNSLIFEWSTDNSGCTKKKEIKYCPPGRSLHWQNSMIWQVFPNISPRTQYLQVGSLLSLIPFRLRK